MLTPSFFGRRHQREAHVPGPCACLGAWPKAHIAPARAEVPVRLDDSVATLHERIKAEERRLLVAVVRALAAAQR